MKSCKVKQKMSLVLYIPEKKSDYYNKLAQKLINSSTSSKTCWFVLKTFVNGKKIQLIPLLNVGDKLIVGFKEKASPFDEFFASKCTPITNNSSWPGLVALNSESSLELF